MSKIFLALTLGLFTTVALAYDEKVETVVELYSAVPYQGLPNTSSNGLEVMVRSSGCTLKSHFRWEKTYLNLVYGTITNMKLVRTQPDRCHILAHPKAIRFTYAEMGLEPRAMYRLANPMVEYRYAF